MNKVIRILLPFLAAALLTACAQPDTFTVKMLPGEYWWGVLDNPSEIDQEQIVRNCQTHAVMPLRSLSSFGL